MKKYRIITDSGCDISAEDEERYGIDIMSFDIILGGEAIRERIDITGHEFLERIAESEDIPKTSQITEYRFEEKFTECVEEGVEDVIVVLINGAGSQTLSNAEAAAERLKNEGRAGNTRFRIIDSHTYSPSQGQSIP